MKPTFFVAENVSGILHSRNIKAFENIIAMFTNAGYDVFWKKLNARDFGVPQDRERVFVIGFKKELEIKFEFPMSIEPKPTLRDVLWDIRNLPLNKATTIFNHDITQCNGLIFL